MVSWCYHGTVVTCHGVKHLTSSKVKISMKHLPCGLGSFICVGMLNGTVVMCHGIKMVLLWYYSGVTVVLPWFYHGVTLVLPRCYRGVALVLPLCYHGTIW